MTVIAGKCSEQVDTELIMLLCSNSLSQALLPFIAGNIRYQPQQLRLATASDAELVGPTADC